MSGRSARARFGGLPLWAKLAAFAVLGVVAMHAVHLAVGNRVASRALARDQAQLGGGVARLIAGEAADPILLHDSVTLSEIVSRADQLSAYASRIASLHAASWAGSAPSFL